jgi:hypothetical protein
VNELRLYVEGGGDSQDQKAQLRRGFDQLLKEIKTLAGERGVSFKIVCSGGRVQAFNAFLNAIATYPQAVSMLLVDAEGPVASSSASKPQDRVSYLGKRDRWDFKSVDPTRVHLMVQCMEAWIVCDEAALSTFYGKNFHKAGLPTRQDIESEPKADILSKLRAATKPCQAGEYGKLRHASKLLGLLNPSLLEKRCPHFRALKESMRTAVQAM